ncbi:MAG TPA: DNA adenine methylase [Paludibacter sp.]|nr:DNA adenine methylase [Paludibacter sp.]
MKYMGSKARFAKEILSIVLKDRTENQWYVEPFAGGMNIICEANGKRIANDIHPNLISLFEAVVYENWKPIKISKPFYDSVNVAKKDFDSHLVGWVGFGCSYSGKYFGGYAGETKTKIGTVRDYQQESINNLLKQSEKLKGVHFSCMPYSEMIIPENSIIYCDPPYENTSKYSNAFNHADFWQWCRDMTANGHKVYVSEYNAPNDFKCVWEKETKSSLSANGVIGGSKTSTERLFSYCQ